MRRTLTLLALCPTVLLAQTVWTVDVGGSTIGTTDPYYAPQNLVIEVGDIVEWEESSGTHNVNGSTSTFPNNPVSFYSGTPQNTQWPWTFTFTVPGFYEYHCDQQGHAATQFGTITVIDPTNVQEYRQPDAVMLFPVPVQDRLMVSINGCTGAQTGQVLNADGRVVRSQALMDSKLNAVDLTGLPAHHAATQFGTITVIDPTNVQEYRQPDAVMLFPVPVQDRLMVSINGCTGAQTGQVLNADGRVVRSQALMDSKLNAVDLTGLPAGNYYLMVLGTGRKPIMKPFVKE